MHSFLAWSAVLLLWLLLGGWTEDTLSPVPDGYSDCSLQTRQSGRTLADLIENTTVLLESLLLQDADLESACCYRQGCDCGRLFSQCPPCGEPRSGVSVWTVDNVEWILRNAKTLNILNGQSIFYAANFIIWVVVVTVPVITLKSVWFMRRMKNAQKYLFTKMIAMLKSRREMDYEQDAELSKYFQLNDKLWERYDQVELQVDENKRLLREKSRGMEEMARVIERLTRENEEYRRRGSVMDKIKLKLERIRLNNLHEHPIRHATRRQDLTAQMDADREEDFVRADEEVI